MVKLTNVCKRFGSLNVLNGINFSAPKGKTTAIIGPSGTGKSTLLRCINLLEIPHTGELCIGEKHISFEDVKKENPFRRQKDILELRRLTGMVFQGFHLFPHKTILENIMEGPIQVLKQNKKDVLQRAIQILQKVDLSDKKDAYPSTLSGGQQQRAAIARALGMEVQVLLFDEPTSALDPELEREVLKVIRSLAQEKNTMIIVTHNLLFAKEVADYVAFMDGAQVAAFGTADEIFGRKLPNLSNRACEFIDAMLPPMEFNI
ncbi:MAG: amino acid ABC transporter ATP-binding protein [Termitinemataceae bacterium]|nr:MAG: amino acid ABC transporter ATP-binding protein [Termitinemataceae bacterium]